MTDVELEHAAREAALAACTFVATNEPALATHALTYYLLDAEQAGKARALALSALVGQLISLVVTIAEPETLAQMSLLMHLEAS